MIPIVAIAGRPNVGKSSLFNCLTQDQKAVVANIAGVTRDRLYGKGQSGDNAYIVIDTGGFSDEKTDIDKLTARQTQKALSEADIVLLVVDARSGILADDYTIAKQLRKLNKSIILVINKIDGLDPASATTDFHVLGIKNVITVSSAHRQNIQALIGLFLSSYAQKPDISDRHNHADITPALGIKVAIIGKPNAGKSTLTNRMLGEERVIVLDKPGTTRDSVYITFTRDDQPYTLIDTAGLRKKSRITDPVEKFSTAKTLQAIEKANVIIFLIDARENLAEQDLTLLGFIQKSGKALIIAINKWDGLSTSQKQQVKNELHRRLQFVNFAKINFISALHGTKVGNLFKDIQMAYRSATKKFPTALLTRLLQTAIEQHQPPLVQGRRIKLRYAHAGGQNPPMIIIHGNQTNHVPESYQRYLQSFFIKHLQLTGTPIQILFKNNHNPYD